jgi:hypothetical protein
MKKLSGTLAIVILAIRLLAQSNAPVRLALIAETDEAAVASDVLTAELSGNKKLQLLERNEIEKVYREQDLSAGNKDYLKLGQILGADGLLLMDTAKEGTNQFLNVRLIAVKPGVVLIAERFSWPVTNLTEWSPSFAKHLDLFLPKLTVLVKDAIPISVVNLRSAIQSADAVETEQQLKLLTIQRLSREPQLFVLERQKMQLLTEEKDLKLDDSAFWNGSYLLEGVVDQNGYSKETITIDARMTPPKGGAPLLFEASGSRTNFSEVINQLAVKVNEALKINSAVKEWNAADEAQQYFEEATWAYGWGMLAEAQMAVDSAWALGKKDRPCAVLRISTCLNQMPTVVAANVGFMSTGWRGFRFVHINDTPDPKDCDTALAALQHYEEFSRTWLEECQATNLQSNQFQPDWRQLVDWYRLGMEVLDKASGVLWHFSNFPGAQEPVREKLAELRSRTRAVAGIISAITKRQAVPDVKKLLSWERSFFDSNGFLDSRAIFESTVKWGCFWQDRPEDTIALYRELMTTPQFQCGMSGLWAGEPGFPRLVVWNLEEKNRAQAIWRAFQDELGASTNLWFRIQAKGLACAHARTEAWLEDERNLRSRERNLETQANKQWTDSCKALLDYISTNYEAIVAGNENLKDHDWGMNALLPYSEYGKEFAAIQSHYLEKILYKQEVAGLVFVRQLDYLKENKPYEFFEFARLFESRNYTKIQALEIQPLIAAYKSNLVAQSLVAAETRKGQLRGGIAQAGFLEESINRILNPPVPQARLQLKAQAPKPIVPTNIVAAASPEPTTNNIVLVNQFYAIPLEDLPGNGVEFPTITAHHWIEGKLLLDFEYTTPVYSFDEKNKSSSTRYARIPAIAIFDLATERWDIITDPEVGYEDENRFYHRTTLLHGELFTCESKQIKKYDFQKRQWRVLDISDGNNYELFAVNGRLYAASRDIIFEILEDGKSTKILASTRRNPPVSTLDREDLGTPTLFEGPNHSLRVCTSSKIFTWTGNDWHEDFAAPPSSSQPDIFTDGLLFRRAGTLNASYQNGVMFRQANGTYGVMIRQDEISCLANGTNETTLGLKGNQDNWSSFSRPGAKPIQAPKPSWKMPANLLPWLPIALRQSDLYILEDQFAVHTIINERHEILQEESGETNEYNAALLCFSHDLPVPQKLFLKFDAPDAKTPTWMLPTTNLLLLGMGKSRSLMPGVTGPMGESGVGHKSGVWIMPLSQIDSASAAPKKVQLEQKAKEEVAAEQVQNEKEQARKNLLAKYDLNYNGIIDPDEKEAALDDPAFIESELDTIDANHNGWLDAEELTWFDANKNKILEPKEQTGIEVVQHLLAERLMKKFDANGDDFLNRSEFNDLAQSIVDPNVRPMPSMQRPFPDENHDGNVDLGELETFLKQQTRAGLRSRGMPRAMVFNQMRPDANQSGDLRQMFKAEVESYWQNPSGVSNQPPFNNRNPPGAGFVPNRIPQSATQ